jgi:oligopeptide/dipeptide ABC transporter ATP-binding protein
VNTLTVENLRTYFDTPEGLVRAVDGVDFVLAPGATLGIVGESGCGKTVACLSILRLIEAPGRIEPGSVIRLRDLDLAKATEAEMRRIRGNEISMIFQEPMTSLNPVFTIGDQVVEVVRRHTDLNAAAARARAVDMLRLVGIPNPDRRIDDYPHELSGGQRQRAMIAMALACEPSVLIADEPTTALDVTIQAEILDLLRELQQRLDMAMIFVSHDLGVISEIADRAIIMYAGQVIEQGSADELLTRPRHPYTEGLLRSLPRVTEKVERLAVIPGAVPNPRQWPEGCRFHPRCPHAWPRCRAEVPPLAVGHHTSRCWLEEEPDRRMEAGAQPEVTGP